MTSERERVIIAARLSRKPRPDEDVEFPIEAQDKRAREWAEKEGFEVVGMAADYKSGTVPPPRRPDLKKWLDEAGEKIHTYDAIVAHKTDRISRGTDADFSTIEAWAVKNRKRLIIVGPDGGIHYPSRHDSDFWQWTATKRQARKEWEDIRSRSMNRQADLKARQKLVGRPPFGYTVIGTKYDKTMIPSDIGRLYVPQIFQRVADGQSLMAVCQWLDSEHVKPNSRKATQWSPKSVAQMIRNRVYVGQRQDADKRTVLEVEPLVDAKLWTDANKRLDNAPRGRRGPSTKEPALLTGAVRCGRCDSPMYRTHSRGGGVYYRCAGKPPQRKGCGVMVSVQLLDSIVDDAMRDDDSPVWKLKFVAGVNPAERLAEIGLALRDLPTKQLSDTEEDAERRRLRSERDNLPEGTPDLLIPVQTDINKADKWIASDFAGKRAMLRSMRVTFAWSDDRQPVVAIRDLAAFPES